MKKCKQKYSDPFQYQKKKEKRIENKLSARLQTRE